MKSHGASSEPGTPVCSAATRRFSSELIERLKREVSLERLAEASGVKLQRHGQDRLGLCPFHDDREPSLVITPSKNLWHCLGKCQTGGSSIDWVMRAQGVSFRHAVELMREDLAGTSAPVRPVKVSTVRRLPSPLERDAGDQELLLQVVRFYHQALKESPEVLGYLEARGLRHPELIERFQLGYSNRTLGYRIPEKSRQAGEEMRTRLQHLGLLRESGHEHFRGSLVVPVFDEHGQVAEIYGRKVRDDLRKGTPLHLYLPGGHRGVWNHEALAASKEIILCEALIDAMTFWCHGFRNVTASYGVCGFTGEHLEALRRHGTETVLIAYDRDEAGDRAAEELAARLVALGLACYRVQFPHGLDANEYARKVDPAPKALGVLLRSAAWLGGPARRAPARFSLVAAAKEEATPVPPPVPSGAAEVSAKPDPAPDSPEDPDLPEGKTDPEPASPASIPPPAAAAPVTLAGDELVLTLEDRTYRARGLPEVLTLERLPVNVFVSRPLESVAGSSLPSGFYVERFDLYARSQRGAFAREAALELRVKEEVIKNDLGQVLLKVEEHLEARKKRAAEPLPAPEVAMSEAERAAALELLRDPRLLERILEDFARSGVVGEETNKLLGYLATVSRKLPEPLAVIVQSSTAAGKSSLMEAVLAFVPEEDRIKYSAMTGQALYYLGETNLKHKVLAIVEEEGAEKASYALKLLQSEGELTIASTGKDPETGKLVTQDYRVEGPVMIFLTTTAAEVDEELLNRCIVLTVNEEREQTRAIHELQRERETLEGQRVRQTRDRLWKLHRNAQRLLRPLRVVNPYARELTFLDDRTRTRRDHLKYLTLIRATALLHQHQRELKTDLHEGETTEYIEVTLEDIAIANRLAAEVLGRSLDELAPQTRRLLVLLDAMVGAESEQKKRRRSDVRFSRREVRAFSGWGQTQLKVHLARLVELEYLVLHHGGRGLSYEYELVYEGQGRDGRPFLCGLLDVDALGAAHGYDGNRSGSNGGWSGVGRPPVGPWSGGGRVAGNGFSPLRHADINASTSADLENADLGAPAAGASYKHR